MIPASYLFKQVYIRAWEEPSVPAPIETARFLDGLMTPLSGAIHAVLSRRPKLDRHHVGTHAYD